MSQKPSSEPKGKLIEENPKTPSEEEIILEKDGYDEYYEDKREKLKDGDDDGW